MQLTQAAQLIRFHSLFKMKLFDTIPFTSSWNLRSHTLDTCSCSPSPHGVSGTKLSSLHGLKSSSAAGHLRPLCAFSAKVVQERPDVAITFLMMGDRRKQVEQEISRYLPESQLNFGASGNIRWFISQYVVSWIGIWTSTFRRIVSISDDQYPNPIATLPSMTQAFPGYYDNLLNSKPVQCLETKTTFDAVRIPNSIILDVRVYFTSPIQWSKCFYSLQNTYV